MNANIPAGLTTVRVTAYSDSPTVPVVRRTGRIGCADVKMTVRFRNVGECVDAAYDLAIARYFHANSYSVDYV